MPGRRIITWAVIIFNIFYVAVSPSGAADAVHMMYNGLHDASQSLSHFVNNI
jgi:hypothetical protein